MNTIFVLKFPSPGFFLVVIFPSMKRTQIHFGVPHESVCCFLFDESEKFEGERSQQSTTSLLLCRYELPETLIRWIDYLTGSFYHNNFYLDSD